jgi:hypothetical protein
VKNLLPPLTDEEAANLEESILTHGFWPTSAIVLSEDGEVLDGNNRKAICDKHGIEYTTVVLPGLTPWDRIAYQIKSNVVRRSLSPAQRRDLLKKLTAEYDVELRRQGAEAQAEGARKGGQARPVQTETNLEGPTPDARARTAAAEASETRFDEPVVAKPKVDRLTTLGNMLGRSRATVHRDEQILDRIEKIETEASRQHRDDVVRLLNQPRPNLDELERAVGLRAALPEVEAPDEDRVGWVHNLAQALNNLVPALTPDEADVLLAKVATPDLVLVQVGQLRGALAEAKQRRGK